MDGGFFILPHEAAVAFNIGAENSGELALHPDGGCPGRHLRVPLIGDYPAAASQLTTVKICLKEEK